MGFVQEKKNYKEDKIRNSPNKYNLVTGTQAQEDCMGEKNREQTGKDKTSFG